MITRKEYLKDSSSLHREYYSQFINPFLVNDVKNNITVDRIKNSTDEHFNDIPLHLWDLLSGCRFSGSSLVSKPRVSMELHDRAVELGEGGISPATMVCIYKEIARQLAEGKLK